MDIQNAGDFALCNGFIQAEPELQHEGGFLERAEEQESGWAIFIGLSSQFPEKGKKVEAAELRNVQYLQAGLGEGRLPQAHFDRAVLVTVLVEIPDQVPALKEHHSALKAGGILSVTEVIFDPHFQRRERVLRAAQAAGFREKISSAGGWLIPCILKRSSTPENNLVIFSGPGSQTVLSK